MVGLKSKRLSEAIQLRALIAVALNLLEQLLRIRANPAACVRLGHDAEPIATSRLTDLDGQPSWVLAFGKEKRDEMVPHNRGDLFAVREGNAAPPQDLASPDGAAPGVASG